MRDAVDSTVVYQSQALFAWDFFLHIVSWLFEL
jgi:hypothetical protein